MKNRIEYLLKKNPLKVLGVGASVIVFLTILIVLVINVGNSYMKSNGGGIPNQVVEGLSFENANIQVENGISKYTVEVKNNLNESITLKTIEVTLKEENGSELTRLIGYIGDSIESGESKILEASIDEEIQNVSKVEYYIHK